MITESEIIPETVSPPPKALSELSMEEIEEWLGRLGLESYAPELRRWGATGEKLLESSHHQLEKELDIKNSLHRKKMMYAIECGRCNGVGFLGSEKVKRKKYFEFFLCTKRNIYIIFFFFVDGQCSCSSLAR